MVDNLYKKDALFVLWDKVEPDDFCFPILITHKSDGGNYYGKWMSFKPELEELGILEMYDEWHCIEDIDRESLKQRLVERGFDVIFGEDY